LIGKGLLASKVTLKILAANSDHFLSGNLETQTGVGASDLNC